MFENPPDLVVEAFIPGPALESESKCPVGGAYSWFRADVAGQNGGMTEGPSEVHGPRRRRVERAGGGPAPQRRRSRSAAGPPPARPVEPPAPVEPNSVEPATHPPEPANQPEPAVAPGEAGPRDAAGRARRGAGAARLQRARRDRRQDARQDGGDGPWREITGSGRSQVSQAAALRARDADRPTAEELAAAEREVVIQRRNWTPDS
jgi:hypothetical protein